MKREIERERPKKRDRNREAERERMSECMCVCERELKIEKVYYVDRCREYGNEGNRYVDRHKERTD